MSDFLVKLNIDIEERSSVLFEMERVIFTKRYNLAQKHIDIFSVQSISMIYSIWEGFVQNSFKLYVDELNEINTTFWDYRESIIVHHMETSFKQLFSYPQNDKKKIDFFLKLNEFYNSKFHKISRIINTESNVSFSVLNRLLQTFSLEPFPKYWSIYNYPNPNLEETMTTFLRYRNGVAHGGDISSEEKVTHLVFEKYKKLVLSLMYAIQDKMSIGLKEHSYSVMKA